MGQLYGNSMSVYGCLMTHRRLSNVNKIAHMITIQF